MTAQHPRHVVVQEGGFTVAAAEVSSGPDSATVRVFLHAASGRIAPGQRASLVDAVMDTSEVRASSYLQATIPCGDAEMLQRLRERTDHTETRAAGATIPLYAHIPPGM